MDLDVTLPRESLPVLSQLCQSREGLPRLSLFSRTDAVGELPKHPLPLRELGGGPLCSGLILTENGPGGARTEDAAALAGLWNAAAARGLSLTFWCGEGAAPAPEQCWQRTEQRPGNRLRCTLAGCRALSQETLRWMGEQPMGALIFPAQWPEQPFSERLWQMRTLLGLGAQTAAGGLDVCRPFALLARLCGRLDPERGGPSREALSRTQALECMTRGPAWLDFREDFLGRLAPGYGADLLVLDRDPWTCPLGELAEIRPLLVMTAGALSLCTLGA